MFQRLPRNPLRARLLPRCSGSPGNRLDAEYDPAVAGHRGPHAPQGYQSLQEGIQPQGACITAAGCCFARDTRLIRFSNSVNLCTYVQIFSFYPDGIQLFHSVFEFSEPPT